MTPVGRAGRGLLMVTVVCAVLLATISAGLSVPATQHLDGFPAPALLDYIRPATGFTRLSEGFIRRVLGLSQSSLSNDAGRARTTTGDRVSAPGPRPISVTHTFTNNKWADAYEVPNVPFTARTNTRTAQREQSEPAACAPAGGVAWYKFRPGVDQFLSADTFGTNYADALGVFSGSSLTDLKQVGCATGPTGNAQVGFNATRGRTYYFQITGLAGGGDSVFNLGPLGTTVIGSVSSSGQPATSFANHPSLSADGRLIVFDSPDSKLGGPPQGPECPMPYGLLADEETHQAGPCIQIWLHDLRSGATEMISESSSGEPANDATRFPSVSSDGRYVAFSAWATNLAPSAAVGGTNFDFNEEVYIRDRLTRTTTIEGGPAFQGYSTYPVLSASGRFLAYQSSCRKDGCTGQELYERDRLTGELFTIDPGDDGSGIPESVSSDGRYVAFVSAAPTMVSGAQATCKDTHAPCTQAYVWDRIAKRVRIVSTSSRGAPANQSVDVTGQFSVSLSADGRFVAFQSRADNLAPGTSDGVTVDAFVHDMVTGETSRVSVSSTGAQASDPSGPTTEALFGSGEGSNAQVPCSSRGTALSGDGRYVLFDSLATNLVPQGGNGAVQIYQHDRLTGATVLLSVSSDGVEGDACSGQPMVTPSGDISAFTSSASNLTPDSPFGIPVAGTSTNGAYQVFVHKREGGPS